MSQVLEIKGESGSHKIIISRGDTFIIKLRAQFGTGYRWELDSREWAGITLRSSHVEVGKELKPGGFETQAFEFWARDFGAETLTFRYVRPWARHEVGTRITKVRVTIK